MRRSRAARTRRSKTREPGAEATPRNTGDALLTGASASGALTRAAVLRYLLLSVLPVLAALALLGSDSGAGSSAPSPGAGEWAQWQQRLLAPLPHFLLQLTVVLLAAKAAGSVMRRLGQPAVIGEMLAGLLLGPSLFGALAPAAQHWLFAPDSLSAIALVSNLGVLMTLLAAGAEFSLAREHRTLALSVSHAGIALPFLLGVALALSLYTRYAAPGAGLVGFALFIGVALSITAFPVLLRILAERGLSATPIGRLATACAAISDASAWCLLAVIVAIVQARSTGAVVVTIVAVLTLTALMLMPLRRRLARIDTSSAREPRLLFVILMLSLLSALITEAAGLHALFGAFVAGIAMSGSARMRTLVEHRIEPLAAALLLPVFFAQTGLRTTIGTLGSDDWLVCLGITALAVFGKFGATTLAARWAGIGKADAARLGALMNTRGLMELVVLNLGFELGIIGATLYSILVVVAVATTLMTAPLLQLIDAIACRRERAQGNLT